MSFLLVIICTGVLKTRGKGVIESMFDGRGEDVLSAVRELEAHDAVVRAQEARVYGEVRG